MHEIFDLQFNLPCNHSPLLEKIQGKFKFQWIFSDMVKCELSNIEMSLIYDVHSTPSVTIHWIYNLSWFVFFVYRFLLNNLNFWQAVKPQQMAVITYFFASPQCSVKPHQMAVITYFLASPQMFNKISTDGSDYSLFLPHPKCSIKSQQMAVITYFSCLTPMFSKISTDGSDYLLVLPHPNVP